MSSVPSKHIKTSIVMLSLLRQPYTARCLESIFKYTSGRFEIIIVDMGKSKRIVSWLKKLSMKHENLTVIFNKDNVGTSKGRNQALKCARGQYIVFLDNDTQVSKGWLEPLIRTANRDRTIGACGAKIVSEDSRVIYCAARIKPQIKNEKVGQIGLEFADVFKKNSRIANREEEVLWYPTTCLLVKKEVLEKVGGFDENLYMSEEDKDLSLSIRRNGYRLSYVPSSYVYHSHENSFNSYNKIRLNFKIFMKDIQYFEKKWSCSVFINHSRKYLKKLGWKDKRINKAKRFNFFNTIIDD